MDEKYSRMKLKFQIKTLEKLLPIETELNLKVREKLNSPIWLDPDLIGTKMELTRQVNAFNLSIPQLASFISNLKLMPLEEEIQDELLDSNDDLIKKTNTWCKSIRTMLNEIEEGEKVLLQHL